MFDLLNLKKRNNEKTEAENLIKKSTKQIQKQEDYASSLLFFNKLLNNISRIFEEVSKNHPDNEGLPNIKTDFTPEQLLAEYKDNEHYNNHVENNLMLAKAFGSPDEVKKLEEIIEKRERTGGGIEEEDWQWIKNNLIKKNSAIYDKLEKEVARNQAEQLAEKISLKNAGKELDKETERNYLLAESEASFKQANAMIEELKEILAEDNEVNAGQEEIYHHITEKLAGYYSAEDEELKAKAKEIEVLLDDVGEKIRVGSLWHSLKKDPFTGKKIVVKLTGNKYGRVQFVIKGTDMRSDETKELFFSLYAPNKSYGEEESFEENTTEGLSDNNTVFLGTDNGCLGTDNGNSFIGETENAEEDAQDFGEGEEGLTYKGKKLKPVKHTKQPRDPNKFLMQFSIFQIRDNIEINESLGKKLEKHSYWIMDDKIVTVGIMYRKYYLCQIKDRIAQDIISKEKMFGEGEVKLKEIENELTAIEGEIGESEISAPVLDLITEIKADLSVEFGGRS